MCPGIGPGSLPGPGPRLKNTFPAAISSRGRACPPPGGKGGRKAAHERSGARPDKSRQQNRSADARKGGGRRKRMTQSAQAWGGTRAGASAGRDGHGQKCGAARRRNSGAPGASLAPPGARPCKGYVFRNLEATNGSDPPPRRGGERGGHCGAGTKRSAANRAERLGAKAGAPPSGRSGAKRRRRRRAESGAPKATRLGSF